MDNQGIIILDTGTPLEHLKFRAELVKTIGRALNLLLSSFLLSSSYGIMETREWRIERENRRTKNG